MAINKAVNISNFFNSTSEFTYKKIKNNKIKNKPTLIKKDFGILSLYIVILIITLLFFPFEKYIFTFKSIDDAYKYAYPEGEIVFQKVQNNTAFVLGNEQKDSPPDIYTFYIRKKGGWKIKQDNFEFRKNRICLDRESWNYNIYTFENSEENIMGIFISSIDNGISEKTKIIDSINTRFESFEVKQLPYRNYKKIVFFGIIEKKITDKYYLSIDEKKYYLQKYKKSCFLGQNK